MGGGEGAGLRRHRMDHGHHLLLLVEPPPPPRLEEGGQPGGQESLWPAGGGAGPGAHGEGVGPREVQVGGLDGSPDSLAWRQARGREALHTCAWRQAGNTSGQGRKLQQIKYYSPLTYGSLCQPHSGFFPVSPGSGSVRYSHGPDSGCMGVLGGRLLAASGDAPPPWEPGGRIHTLGTAGGRWEEVGRGEGGGHCVLAGDSLFFTSGHTFNLTRMEWSEVPPPAVTI